MRGQFLADMLLFSLHNSTHRLVLLSTCLRAQKPFSCSYKQTLFQAQYTETRYSVFSNFIKKHRKCYEFNVIYINIIKYNIFYIYILSTAWFFCFYWFIKYLFFQYKVRYINMFNFICILLLQKNNNNTVHAAGITPTDPQCALQH